MPDKKENKEKYEIEFVNANDKNNKGVLELLSNNKNVKVENVSDREFKEHKILDSCYKHDIPDFSAYFGNFLKNFFKPTNKDKEIKTTMQFFRSNKPNNRGSHISDFRVLVNNEQMPFSNLDQVDYFLTNYIGYVENHNKKKDDPTKITDPDLIKKKFFNKYEKEYSHFPAEIERILNIETDNTNENDKDSKSQEKVDAAGAGGKPKRKGTQTKKNKQNGKKMKKQGKSKRNNKK